MTTKDPKLVRSSVTIEYHADDGYTYEYRTSSQPNHEPAHAPLLEALEDLARLTALFGYEDEALERFNAARKRVADWRAAR